MARKFPNGIDLQNQKVVNLADGSNPTDAVTKQQLDSAVAGLSWKQPVKAATTANITLSGTQTIDGISILATDRVLVKDQTTATGNGIYVAAAGAWTRATDADSTAELSGAAVYVTSGTVNGDKAFTQTTEAPTIGSSNIVWAQIGGGSLPVAGNGLTLTGSTLDVGAGTGISVGADSVAVDTAVVVRKFSIATHASTTSITINHGLGTTLTTSAVFITSTGEEIFPDVTHTDANNTAFGFGVAPTANSLTFVIHG